MPDQSRQKAFLARASTILAASQGLTPDARQQLAAAASQLRLTPDEWAGCMAELGQQADAGPVLSRYEEDFLQLAREALQRSTGRILSLGRESRLLRAASRKYQIALVRADQLLDEVCRELDVRRLSRSDAAAAFEGLACELVGKSRRHDERVAGQLAEAGNAWGLPPAEARATARRLVLENRREYSRSHWRLASRLGLAACSAVVLAWAGWIWTERFRRPESGPPEDPVQLVSDEALPDWWPADEIRKQLEQAESGRLLAGRISQLGNRSAAGRTQQYREFGEWAADQPVPTAILGGRLLTTVVAADPERTITSDWLRGSSFDGNAALQTVPTSQFAINQQLSVASFLDAFAASEGSVASADRHDAQTATRWLKTRTNGQPDQVLKSWWQQLAQVPDAVLPDALPSVLSDLREVSADWLPADVMGQLHRDAVLAALKANPDSFGIMDVELSVAVSGLTEATAGPWLLFWQIQSTNKPANRLGLLLLARLRGIVETEPSPETSRELGELVSREIARRYPGVGERMRMYTLSSELATVWLREQPDNPLTVAVTGQAVNDGLLALAEIRAALEGRPRGREPAWRFEPRDVDPTATPNATAAAALATPSDLRALDAALGEIGTPDTSVDRGGFRAAALEEMVRIAARLDDLLPAQAEVLATYYLAGHRLEEWLAAEKNLPAFRFWPRFLLAIADQIEASTTAVDQAITVVQLTAEQRFSVSGEARWRNECRMALRRAARDLLVAKTRSAGNDNAVAWDKARVACERIFASRDQLVIFLLGREDHLDSSRDHQGGGPPVMNLPLISPDRRQPDNALTRQIQFDLQLMDAILGQLDLIDPVPGQIRPSSLALYWKGYHDPGHAANLARQLRGAEECLHSVVAVWITSGYWELLSR